MAGNHFLHAMLSAPCGCCCQRVMKTWQIIVHLKQLLMCFLLRGGKKKKRRLQPAGADAFLSSACPLLLGLAFVDEGSVGAAQSTCLG